MTPVHPDQPLVMDADGVVRFKKNPIVDFLLDWAQKHGMGLNELHSLPGAPFAKEDWEQFNQLIGYSVSGWGDLSCHRRWRIAVMDKAAEEFLEKRRKGKS